MLMNFLLELREEEIFPDTLPYEVDDSWEDRLTVKVIVIDNDKKIALFGIRYLLLPGGGVEDGETLEQAVKRECLEEVGCNVEVIKEVGVTREFRLKTKRKQETHCFVAKVVGEKGKPQSDQEDELDAKVEWFSIGDALKLLKENKEIISPLSYNSQFNVRTHIAFLKKYIEEIS